MRSNTFNSMLIKSALAASALLLGSGAAFAQQQVNLTAGPATATLPDGQAVPMWGYSCGAAVTTNSAPTATCAPFNPAAAANPLVWSPVVITVPTGQVLQINLTNLLTFSTSGAANNVPTSLVIDGQLGGGLGTDRTTAPSPAHPAQGTTWPGTLGTTNPGDTVFTPPGQPDRVRSLATEVAVGNVTSLTWSNLRPGTYLIHSGTQPSIQHAMGLYGVLVVTEADTTTTPPTHQAYGTTFDIDVPLLLSEIDPVQNRSVDAAVRTAGFSDTKVWSGMAGDCGDPSAPVGVVNTCYPPVVNYSPLYYLVNGSAFDRTSAFSSAPAVPAAVTTGNLLLRFVNAGLRMHVPSVVGASMTLVAEDGNKLPGTPRVQSEVFLAAGKTYDVAIQPKQTATTPPTYARATYAVFDRQLSLSTSNQRDGGMQVYVNVCDNVGCGTAPAPITLSASNKSYYCVASSPLAITDPAKGLLGGAVGANGVVLPAPSVFTGDLTATTLALQSDGTFTYTPTPGTSCGGTFQYLVNGTASHTATISQCDANSSSAAGCSLAAAPTVANVQFTSNIATRYQAPPPGVLAGVTSNTGGFALSAVGTGTGVTLNPDGSFVATSGGAACPTTGLNPPAPAGATCVAFTYQAKNAQGTLSNTATATVVFLPASNLVVNVLDAKTQKTITDYRWIIEEDRTFWVDPKCQVNTGTGARPLDSYGRSCPPLPVESQGYSFHTSSMPVLAQGCVGSVSCESGQTVQGQPATCDIGNGACRATSDPSNLGVVVDGTAGQKTPIDPKDVSLDPTKHYFISILPGDGVNPVIGGAGGPAQVDPTCDPATTNCAMRQFDITQDCGPYTGPTGAWEPGGAAAMCGHAMGGAQIVPVVAGQTAHGPITISLQQTPLPTAKISAFVFQDDNPLNGENDAGGGVDVLAPNEPGLGGFELKLFDQAGALGDATGQITYDMFNQPVSNSLAGTLDPLTGLDACPITPNGSRLVGMIPTCPKYESDGATLSPLAGQAIVANLYPGLYEIQAFPGADRIARGEEWLQTNTLDGGKAHEAFIRPNEPGYFQEFGPGGYHVAIGFANPAIINSRKALFCASTVNTGPCNKTLNVHVSNTHMSRTPDQRTYSSETYDNYSFTTCYISVGPADGPHFALEKCDANGNVTFTNMPAGTFQLTVFDQWNDIILDGLVGTVQIDGTTATKEFPVNQWRANLYTRTFIDTNGDGVSNVDANGNPTEPGLALVNTNIRYRDGSVGFFNNTDLNGFAGWNEVFPFMNWLVVETTSTRFKPTAVHTVYDAGGPVDCSSQSNGLCSSIAANLANTDARVKLPAELRVPGAKYCDAADCPASDAGGGASTGTIFPPQPWGTTQGWQGLLGQNSFMEFGVKPFATGETGGINGQVIYASTRPFDDPSLLLQLSWEPGVARVKINLYAKTVDANGNEQLKLVDTTTSASWDDWAQGFRKDANGNLMRSADGNYIPNMNCPGQDGSSPFFLTLKDSTQWLDTNTPKLPLALHSQFKCYDGWSMLNQIQPAPYDGMYSFPSVTTVDPATGKPAGTNCHTWTTAEPWGCTPNPDSTDPLRSGSPMLAPGKYVVEVVVPPGYELVKEEDKNILLGDVYIAPVTQQFAGFGNIFIMPDQASVNAYFNKVNPGGLDKTLSQGRAGPSHEGDTGSVEQFWPCVGAERIVPDMMSLFPGAGQASPFAGAKRRLCNRKEVDLNEQTSALAKFYVFSSTHIAAHFTGTITNDFAAEFDPFSPQFGEKFGPPNLPVAFRDFNNNEVARVYSDQWGVYDGLYFSTYGVNPPNPTGYVPQMPIACMNDPGPIPDGIGGWKTDPLYNPAYSDFCYEWSMMPGTTAYMDTPVLPTQAFADGYNLPDTEYPDATPAIKQVVSSVTQGPWVPATAPVASLNLTNRGSGYTSVPAVTITAADGSGSGATASATMRVTGITVTSPGSGYLSRPAVTITGPAAANPSGVTLKVRSVSFTQTLAGTCSAGTHNVTFNGGGASVQATGTATVARGKLTAITVTGPAGNVGGSYNAVPTVNVSNCSGLTTTAKMGVRAITVTSVGSGYTAQPTVTIAPPPAGPGNSTATAFATMSVNVLTLTSGGSGYDQAPTVTFAAAPAGGTTATATAVLGALTPVGTLTLTALGDKVVQNPNFSGPNSTTAPFNTKTITRHYGFGAPGNGARVSIGGVDAPVTSWTDTSITVTVPSGIPPCAVTQRGVQSLCGELVITAANGKQSIDAITVTAGGSAPWIITANDPVTNLGGTVTAPPGKSVKDYGQNFGRMFFSPIQVAIDSATAGDLILVQPGTYREHVIMWKPVRLQGVGAASVTIDASAHPAGKMEEWRRQVTCVFGLTLDGAPNLNNTNFTGIDPNNGLYSCPSEMHQRVDRIPFEAIVGWDTAGNGNLAQVLQEPTLMGSYEGAGVTVLGRGIRLPDTSVDFWGQGTTEGDFPAGSAWLTNSNADCATSTNADGRDYGTSNYLCSPSRIDGVSIANSSQGGGGIFIHAWAHKLEVANTRIFGNQGTLAGAINVGNGEIPDVYLNDGVECGVTPAVVACPPIDNSFGTIVLNAAIPFQFNTDVHIHHNMLYNNSSIGDALFSGTPAGAGGITVSAGADGYRIDHNWIAGNLSTGDGGGLQHIGPSFNGNISSNYVLFNQSTNPTLPTHGGGIVIEGANLDKVIGGAFECGATNDQDCPPGLGEGTGPRLVIDANLILGNSAESGSGGGLRISQVNGSELVAFPQTSAQWYDVTVTNNVIANNVAGYDGGGVSMQDALKVTFWNNTVVSNDTTASAGVLFKTLGAITAAAPPPGCTPTTDPNQPQNPNCTIDNAQHGKQPAGLVTMSHTPNMIAEMPATVTCPTGFNYGGGTGAGGRVNGDCRIVSKPAMSNDLFWQNRSFQVDITSMGTGNQSQQNLIVLSPVLNQAATGQCATGTGANAPYYWDVGIRTDDTLSGVIPAGTRLTLNSSIVTDTTHSLVTGNNLVTPTSSPVVAQFCNGARVPPENCAGIGGQVTPASCLGYNAPPGASETTGLLQVFTFNNIKPTATVDEGHNWLNLNFGPLTLNRSAVQPTSPNPPELMVASKNLGTTGNASLVGLTGGAYSIPGTSPAVNAGTNFGAPATVAKDYFGNPRALTGTNRADIGAVEFQQGGAPLAGLP